MRVSWSPIVRSTTMTAAVGVIVPTQTICCRARGGRHRSAHTRGGRLSVQGAKRMGYRRSGRSSNHLTAWTHGLKPDGLRFLSYHFNLGCWYSRQQSMETCSREAQRIYDARLEGMDEYSGTCCHIRAHVGGVVRLSAGHPARRAAPAGMPARARKPLVQRSGTGTLVVRALALPTGTLRSGRHRPRLSATRQTLYQIVGIHRTRAAKHTTLCRHFAIQKMFFMLQVQSCILSGYGSVSFPRRVHGQDDSSCEDTPYAGHSLLIEAAVNSPN
jgi:hypothetical protein